jgi:hypothetical protein
MNDEWNAWLKEIEAAAQEVGQHMQETVETIFDTAVETADWMLQVPMAIAEQMEDAIATEMDQVINELVDWFQPPVNLSIEFDATRIEMEWHSTIVEPWTESVDPTVFQYKTCIGCKHYHGYAYNGNVLVCGMHPYGWDGEACPDWESDKA